MLIFSTICPNSVDKVKKGIYNKHNISIGVSQVQFMNTVQPSSANTISDYDICIPEIQLIHRSNYKTNMRYAAYSGGRMTFGLVFVLQGNANFNCDHGTICASPGEVIFLPAKAKYIVQAVSECDFVHYTVNFSIIPNKTTNGELYHYIDGDRIIPQKVRNVRLFESGFSRLLSVWDGKKSGFRLAAKSELYILLSEFFSELEESKIDRSNLKKIRPAKEYLDENFTRNTTISELARICDMSETHMRRLFREVYRISPIEYQINLRILRAKDLLLSKMYTVNEVSDMCGFSDASYFGRIFKQNVGVSPLKYKNNN